MGGLSRHAVSNLGYLKENNLAFCETPQVNPHYGGYAPLSVSLERERKEDGLLCSFHSRRKLRSRTLSVVWSGSGGSAKLVPSAPVHIPIPWDLRSELSWVNIHIDIRRQVEEEKKNPHALSLGLKLDALPSRVASQRTCSFITKTLSFFNSGNIFEKTGLNEREWDVRTLGAVC